MRWEVSRYCCIYTVFSVYIWPGHVDQPLCLVNQADSPVSLFNWLFNIMWEEKCYEQVTVVNTEKSLISHWGSGPELGFQPQSALVKHTPPLNPSRNSLLIIIWLSVSFLYFWDENGEQEKILSASVAENLWQGNNSCSPGSAVPYQATWEWCLIHSLRAEN